MDIALFSVDGLQFIFRWIHFLAGVAWIGLLYYFNFVQGEFFKEIEAGPKNIAISKLVPRALFWFRWSAMFTFISGVVILGMKGHGGGAEIFKTSWGITILVGATLGTLMFLNVWLIIWPNQKIVIASTQDVLAGKPANPAAAAAGAKALLASRTNVCFSIPMLFFMGAASHLPLTVGENFNCGLLTALLVLVIGGIELNTIKGKLGPLTTIKGVIHCGLGLAVVLYAILEVVL
ncbi:MAG: urate hydroxylase PuuD [Bacteriovoracaceae bacterium]